MRYFTSLPKMQGLYNEQMYKVVEASKGVIQGELLTRIPLLQVCRAAYELMQPIRGDASGWFKSLDDIYYYGGQHPHEFVAVESHTRTQQFEIDLRVGDIIHMAGNHWDGYSKGANTRTGQTGLFPSYKVRDKVVKVKMPTYPQVTPDR